MKKFIMGMAAALVALGLTSTAPPASAATNPYKPTISIKDSVMRPASGCVSLGTWAGMAMDPSTNTFSLSVTYAPYSGQTQPTRYPLTGTSGALPNILCADTTLGSYSAVVSRSGSESASSTYTYFAITPYVAPPKPAPAPAPAPAPQPTPSYNYSTGGSSNGKCATRAEYRRIKRGMTLTKVKRIVGSKGQLNFSSSVVKVRQWATCSNEYGVMTVGFNGRGRVQSKSYFA